MDANFKRNLIVSSGISVFILIISAGASFFSINSLLESSEMVNHTYSVINNLHSGSNGLVEAQSSMRGFLVTGNRELLDNYEEYKETADFHFNEVALLTGDNPAQLRSMKEFMPVKEQFVKYLDLQISNKAQGIVMDSDSLQKGRAMMGKMRELLRRMEAEEQKLLDERTSASEKYSYYSLILIVVGALIAISISIIFFVRILRDYNHRVILHRELEKSERDTAERIRVINSVARQIASGNYTVKVDTAEGDALGSIGTSLNDMAVALNTSFENLSDKEWHQSGIAELNQVMIGEKQLKELTDDVLEYVCNYTGCSAGALYLLENDHLELSAGYSYKAQNGTHLKLGEGLTGQAAESGKVLEITGLSADNIKISYALGEAIPAHVIALPLIDDRVTGVLELACVKELTERDKEFLATSAGNIATAISAARSRKRVQELLEETQAQSEELRAQHTELESINAELEAQTEKLQASEEELRVQQEELQQTNEELAERSVLLEEKNVEIQKKSEDLEISTRYKSEFLANMSHELRTPLNSILLLSRLLAENGENNMSKEQVEFASVINSSGHGLLGLIDEILDLSKIEAGKMELEYQDIAVSEITSSLKALFTAVAREKNIEFKIEADNAPLVIRTDKMRLEQILKNLISNAIKFTSEGSVTLSVIPHPKNDRMVQFAVKDTGIGIPREKQPLIFEAFQQADGSTKRKYGGTGLGLSISRELARLLNGEITLVSASGEGSTFTLSIPVIGSGSVQVADRPVRIETVNEEVDEVQGNDTEIKKYISAVIPDNVDDDKNNLDENDKSILIVEDDVNFAKSLVEFTRKRGYKAISTVRGDQALEYAIKYRPVGVLLDIELPVKSGWEVMEELKNEPETRHIPVHIMSSHKLKQESLLRGAVNFLDKPVAYEQIPDIFSRIEHIVNRDSQKVLIFEDNPKHAKALAYFLETNEISSEIRSEITEGIDTLKRDKVDCVILDMGIPDKQAYEMLENVKKNEGLENLPIIVFTGKSLSMKEELKIKKYADSIVVKTAHSYQRMLDEVSLFLHLVEDKKAAVQGIKKASLLNNVLTNKKVLVVDDDVRNIYSLTKSLETLKMNVISAIDGKEALKALDENPDIDVVLLDMMMPNMDGYETATRIRQINKFKNLPVIAVTAKAMTGDREKCINAGASDYITKPVDVDQLMSLLRVWLYDKQ